MTERAAEVLQVAGDRIELRPLGQCSDCGGCGGRCQLFGGSTDSSLSLPASLDPATGQPWAVGQHVFLYLPSGQLQRQALLGYGLPVLGLLLGAAALQAWGDVAAAAGAVGGTSLALLLSKRVAIQQPELRSSASTVTRGDDAGSGQQPG